MKKVSKKGFTIIELLVVIAIIGVLVTIVVVAINPAERIQDAQDSRMRADLNQIKAAMQLYYNDCRFYPNTIPTANAAWDPPVAGDACDDNTVYMRLFPANTAGGSYLYAVSKADGTVCAAGETCANYVVGAVLNNPNTDDANSLTKCSAPALAGDNFAVCND